MKTIIHPAAISAAHTFAELGKPFLSAVRTLAESGEPIYQVCGPISTGGAGNMHDNIAIFARAIVALDEKLTLYVVDQMPYEDAMQRIKEVEKKNPATDYHESLLHDFYLPVFTCGCVTTLVFLPGWIESTGSRWEYLQAKRLGIQTIQFIDDWETALQNATFISDITQEILPEKYTAWEYDAAIKDARAIFVKKASPSEYGGIQTITCCRPKSLYDQIMIKLKRIRTLQLKEEKGIAPSVNENKKGEFLAVINYAIVTLLRMDHGDQLERYPSERVFELYDEKVKLIKNLMIAKNSDYGEAWRDMYQDSFVDLPISKMLRIRSLNEVNTTDRISEGIDANYHDIVNYCVFALIMMMEGKHTA
jgi:Nucleotide modification associated domain 1